MNIFAHPVSILTIIHALIILVIAVRVIMIRPATGVALAWLLVVVIFPFIGPLFYLLIGERRTGLRSQQQIDILRTDYENISDTITHEHFTDVDWTAHAPCASPMR